MKYISTFADISRCGAYRYSLQRAWRDGAPVAIFIGLNPSTADASIDDPTIRRCVGFADSWGCGALVMLNLFALRSTDPRELYNHPAPIGPENNNSLAHYARSAAHIVACWGAHGKLHGRDAAVIDLLGRDRLHALRFNKDGSPAHPLYLPAALKPIPFLRARGAQ